MRLCSILLLLAAALTLAGCASSSPGPARAPVAASGSASLEDQIQSLLDGAGFRGELWRTSLSDVTGEPTRDRLLAVSNDLVLIEDQDQVLRALETEAGVHRWIVGLPGPITQPPGDSSMAVAAVSDDLYVAVSREAGSRLIDRPYRALEFSPSSRGVVANDGMFIGRLAPYGLQSVDLRTGLAGWTYPTRSTVIDVVVEGEGPLSQVLLATDDGLIASLAPMDPLGNAPRTERWQVRLPGAGVVAPVSLADGFVYVSGSDGFVYAISTRNGRIEWKYPCESDLSGWRPMVAGGAVYVRAVDEFHALDAATGAELWSCPESLRLITRLGDYCIVEVPGREAVVREAATGGEVRRFSLAGLQHVPGVQGGGVFIAGDGAGNLFALR